MALRKLSRLTYRQRLFFPMLLMVWMIIICMSTWEYYRSTSFRTEVVQHDLDRIGPRILYAYERDVDIHDYLDFLKQYMTNTLFAEAYVTVYGRHNAVVAHLGPQPLPSNEDLFDPSKVDSYKNLVKLPDDQKVFYVNTTVSPDSNLKIAVVMPETTTLRRALTPKSSLYILGLILTIVGTGVVYFSTASLSRNIVMLRNLANAAAEGKPISDVDNLPHDEIGDISREIFRIYEQRLAAMEKSSREHRIALHAVEEKSRIRRTLTNNINHELKTPIGVIRGYIDTILANPDMDDATRTHFLTRTLQNVERLCALMNDVSTMTRLEEGAENIPLSDVDMHDLLYAIENDVYASKINGNMKFSFNVPFDCHVQGNQNLLSGMIMNLIKNAVLHSHGTEMTFSLISESPKFYVFAFADNGTGVDAEHIPHLFERFYRVDSGRSRKVGGTGLGLPIVKNTVTSMGGTISVHNRSTGGLEFVFSLKKWI